MKLPLVILFISFASFLSGALSNDADDVKGWCNQTPYPEQCTYYMSQSNRSFTPNQKSEFKKMAVQLALDHALDGESENLRLGSKCRNAREKAAWADCVELYRNTISQLKNTLEDQKSTEFDAQTWLSTALTNLETCRTGFIELGVANNVLPLMSNNVTKLISNTLALNNATTPKQTYDSGFPTWVSPGDRKLLQSSSLKADLVVAQDGSGNYTTITEALSAAATRNGTGRFVIYIRPGVYYEQLEIGLSMMNIMLVGDSMRYTTITGNLSVIGGSTTFASATVAVTGSGFIARGITFRNTAGALNQQAVAFRSGADLSVFYRCGFEGYQDTIYVHSQRQFYRECYIYGTVDFIFGNAAVVFQNCMILVRKPIIGQQCTVTAQGRTDPNQNTGISIQSSRIMPAPELQPFLSLVQSYLGRPWKLYSRTVYLKCFMDAFIDPTGWLPWNATFAFDTLYYGEYHNIGPGSSTSGRVNWTGYHVITRSSVASEFTVANFIAGTSWLPTTGVPFRAGI